MFNEQDLIALAHDQIAGRLERCTGVDDMAAREIDALTGVALALAVALALGWRWETDEDGQRVLVGPDCPEGGVVWQRRYYPDRHALGDPHSLPDYPGDLAAAWQLVEDAQQRGYWCRLQTPFTVDTTTPWGADDYWAGFTPHGTTGWNGRPDHWTPGATPATAICRAWLRLIAEVGDGQD